MTAPAIASDSVFRSKSSTGGTIFSDAPVINGQLSRTSYNSEYGRPVARSSCRGLTEDQLTARARAYDKTIKDAANMHKVEAELISAVAAVESCFDPKAISRVGAEGIMQLMPGTASDLGVVDSFDAAQNINGGAIYLAKMLKRFNQNYSLALAAYNAGPGAVDKHKGIPPFPETQNYVQKVMQLFSKSKSGSS